MEIMNDTKISSSENKLELSNKGLTWAKLFVALSLLMVVFILALACNYYIYGSENVVWGDVPYDIAIFLFPFYFFGISIRKVWSFYMALFSFICWAFPFLLIWVFMLHISFFRKEYGFLSFIDFEMKLLAEYWISGLSVVVLFLGLVGSAKLLEKKYGRKVFSRQGHKPISLLELLVVVSIVAFLMGILLPALARVKTPSYQMKCGTNLIALGIAIRSYSEQFEGNYPPADKWCDLLIQHCDISSEQFKCPQDKKSNCSFTFNPSCEPNSPPDSVLLFESKGGWNSFGGQELIKPRHQNWKGCNILFNDGYCKFVKTDDIPNLNWGQQH